MSTSTFFFRTFFTGRRRIAAALGTGALLLGATACGSSSADDAPASSGQSSGSGASGQGAPGGRGFPGASGEVVAVTGSTAQVQSQRGGQATGQTAVSWSDSTAFTQEVSGSLDDVTVGSCVMVRGDQDSGSSDGTVTAATVRITAADGDSCATGMPGGRSGQAGEMPSPPEGMPSPPEGMPEGGPGGSGRGPGEFGGAFGKVTAVGSSGFTVESSLPGAPGSDSGSTETSTVEVTVGSATTYTTQADAEAGDVKVGVCLQARGESDSAGAIAATTVSLSQPVDGSCSGFGMGGFPGGPGSGGAGAGSGDTGQES